MLIKTSPLVFYSVMPKCDSPFCCLFTLFTRYQDGLTTRRSGASVGVVKPSIFSKDQLFTK